MKTTTHVDIHSRDGWRERLEKCRKKRGLGLTLLLLMLMPSLANAESTYEYDFETFASNLEGTGVYQIDNGDAYSITNLYYGVSYFLGDNTMDFSRFAFRHDKGWKLRKLNASDCGMVFTDTEPRLAITKLRAGDEISITFHGQGTQTKKMYFESGDATLNGTTLVKDNEIGTSTNGAKTEVKLVASSSDDIVIKSEGGSGSNINHTYISKIVIYRPDGVPQYAYVPAVETYVLSQSPETYASASTKQAGFKINNADAYYIANPNGLSLNKRLASNNAIEFKWNNNGLSNDKGGGYRFLSITNLRMDDRVRITYETTTSTDGSGKITIGNIVFASRYNKGFTQFNSKVYKEEVNDGVLDEADGEAEVNLGDVVVSGAVYTMLEDGHLDIALQRYNTARITKIEIFSDRKSGYVITDNNDDTGSYTLTLEGTGQLLEKTAYLPSGMTVSFGDETSTAERVLVTLADEDNDHKEGYVPVAHVKDLNGYQFTGFKDDLPKWGTFYKFVPEVAGSLTLKWKAKTVQYGSTADDETVVSVNGKYYVAEYDVASKTITNKWGPTSKGNGANMSCTISDVKNGKIYYLCGQYDAAHGIPCLYEATFQPAFNMSSLAYCGENGMTSFDGSTTNPQIKLSGNYTNLKLSVKRTSDNITVNDNDLSIAADGSLKISNISYEDDADKAGVVLVNVETTEGNAVFALTIPYSAAYNNGEGHKWDFSTEPLEIGNYYADWFTGKQANGQAADDQATNSDSQLYKEINKTDGTSADWVFTYRVKKSNGNVLDPMFLNVYDMEGDNADMIWETGGLWFSTPSNKSAIFNEYLGTINHNAKNNKKEDPDRYVAILPDGSFTIPGLKKDDRVIIYMGSGDGSGTNTCYLNITNARDALYKEIAPTDEYRAGGSEWNTLLVGHDDPNYRGCYHFYAKEDGDMTFTMVGGSMTKIYSIEIYQGERRETNDILDQDGSNYLMVNTEGDAEGKSDKYVLHYRGKGEGLANPEVLKASGTVTYDTNNENPKYTSNGNDHTVTYVSKVGEFGVIRLRLKDMEYNNKYVADFADRNLTIGYKQKVTYPYTWDFTAITKEFDTNSNGKYTTKTNVTAENTRNNVEPTEAYERKSRNISMWKPVDGEDNTYDIQICHPDYNDGDNYIFYQNKYGKGNQLYANDKIIPETKGLWFYFDSNDGTYNGSMRISPKGLHLANPSETAGAVGQDAQGNIIQLRRGWWNNKVVIPAVPAKAAVYLRAARDERVSEEAVSFRPYTSNTGNGEPGLVDVTETFFYKSYQFDGESGKTEIADGTNCRYYQVKDTNADDPDGDDYIIAIYNNGDERDLTLTLNGWILKKLSVSTDPKTVNEKGWATESRDHVIDPELTAYMTGYNFETCLVTDFDAENRTVTLSRPNAKSKVMRALTDGQNGANIIHNKANAEVKILDGGFHLFVPNFHDFQNDDVKKDNDITSYDLKNAKSVTNSNIGGIKKDGKGDANLMVAQVTAGTIPASSNRDWSTDGTKDQKKSKACTNYAMSFRYYKVDQNGNIIDNTVQTGDEAFYRIVAGGAKSSANKAFLALPTDDMKKDGKFSNIFTLVYEDEAEQELNGIEETTVATAYPADNVWYSLSGQKLNGRPTTGGIYIVNGRKVVVK